MRVCAIIAEYNPLHEGHIYHIQQTRLRLGADTPLIAVMSGHVAQRGDFPILQKAARTEMALRAGHSLVFELPAPHACAPAERFARGALSIIAKLGIVTHLSFGAETDDLPALQALAEKAPAQYPKDMSLAAALPALFPAEKHLFTPNNILALEYLRGLRAIAPHIKPVLIPRRGSAHDDDTASASACRKRLLAGCGCKSLPFADIIAREKQAGRAPVTLLNAEKAVLSQLRRLSAPDFSRLPDVSGGLENRLYAAAQKAGTLPELYALAKTKRYTMSRIRRSVLSAFLNITEEDALTAPHMRLLGIGQGGQDLLSQIQAPILSRPAGHKGALTKEALITDQFSLCMPCPEPGGLEWRTGVVVAPGD